MIEFTDPEARDENPPHAAVLVVESVSRQGGMWLSVKSLGAETGEEKKKVDSYFKGGRRKIHICYVDREGRCPLEDEDALHLERFRWYPPGDFTASWLTAAGKRLVKQGMEKAVNKDKVPLEDAGRKDKGDSHVGESLVEKRLSALRPSRPRVTFAEPPVVAAPSRREGAPMGVRDGIGGPRHPSRSADLGALTKVKSEEAEKISDSDATVARKKVKKKRSLGETLAKAARVQNVVEERKEKRDRSRSLSQGKKKKKKRKRKDSDSEGSNTSEQSSSSDASLMAPLKKRSRKSPGSVYRMLEETAVERLSADGIVEEGYEAAGLKGQKPKMLTFFQLVLRPLLDPRSRDCKELSMLARSLDLLREGRLAELADVLASRLIAVDTAGRQGWHVARHLEVYGEEEENSAPPHVLLAAQKHARQVDKAGGKGSWAPTGQWPASSWGQDQRPKGKGKEGKGKTKKGKGKNKTWKGAWGSWGPDTKEKAGDPKKKSEGET